ncbi:MAG: type II toxin-antitoxin system Phd/YefM family antitoxin [Carbonactinosporaceae bacterium]
MERFVGVEEARGTLGRLAEDVARGEETVWLTKHGRPLAVLVSRDEYARLRQQATQVERAELAELLAESRRRAAEAGVDTSVVDEAIDAARRLS